LDRWRELLDQSVVHDDARWGIGRVVDVRWAQGLPQVPAHVQLKVRYETAEILVRAGGLADKHSTVLVPRGELARLIDTCYDPCGGSSHRPSEPCEKLISSYTKRLRERRTRERLERVADLRRRVARRRSGPS